MAKAHLSTVCLVLLNTKLPGRHINPALRCSAAATAARQHLAKVKPLFHSGTELRNVLWSCRLRLASMLTSSLACKPALLLRTKLRACAG